MSENNELVKEYKYDISVVIPVYNSELTLKKCINSVLGQTIDTERVQIILVDNNSVDGSKEICLEYSLSSDNIIYIEESQQGVSYARNSGIEKAEGKYIVFLDSDDCLGKKALLSVFDFFEKNYDKTDLVALKLVMVDDEKEDKDHIRDEFLKKTGIYDLEKTIYSLQLNVNICVKNENPVRFDGSMKYQEDQKYCIDTLKEKLTMGYVKEAKYYYLHSAHSATKEYLTPINYFESSIELFESYYDSYEEVPAFIQADFFHDCMWKWMSNLFWPYHYSEEEFEKAKNRVVALLNKTDNSIICSYPKIDIYTKSYWLRLKSENDLMCLAEENGVRLISGCDILYHRKNVEVVLREIKVRNGKIKIKGFYKSVSCDFISDIILFYELQTQEGSVRKEIPLRDCAEGYYKVKEKTNTFFGFIVEEEIGTGVGVKFGVEVCGIPQIVVFHNMKSVEFSAKVKTYLSGKYKISQEGDVIRAELLTEEELVAEHKKELGREGINDITKRGLMTRRGDTDKEIWLYVDSKTVVCDNAYYQYLNDHGKDDGIERYYIVTNDKIIGILDDTIDKNMLVAFGSDKHEKLFFRCSKILTSYIEDENIWPYSQEKVKKQLMGGFNAELIYLQHGVMHAHLPWYYSKMRSPADKIVISSDFEKENLLSNYGYEETDLYETGMPRFDMIDLSVGDKSCKRILFAPSWRKYLTGDRINEDGSREAKTEKMRTSSYFKGIIDFLTREELKEFLEKNDLYLDVKMHPIFINTYSEFFENMVGADKETDEVQEIYNYVGLGKKEENRIRIVQEGVNEKDYICLITDFSSMLYDYVYTGTPVLYYIPDYEEFLVGMNHYRELDMPLEDGFGPWTDSCDELLENLKMTADNDFIVQENYREKYESFFKVRENAREALYDMLTGKQEEF